jgi:hypothetical protein
MSETRSHTKSDAHEERLVVGSGIFGEDYVKLSKWPDGEFTLLLCKGLEVHSVALTKKQVIALAKMLRKGAAHKSDEQNTCERQRVTTAEAVQRSEGHADVAARTGRPLSGTVELCGAESADGSVPDDDYDGAPYCSYCGARRRQFCTCGHIAENE